MPSRYWARTNVGACMVLTAICLMVLSSCTPAATRRVTSSPRAMYYWRTTFEPDSAELAFLRQHHIGRLYLRYFDVAINEQHQVVPVGTCTFAAQQPDGVEVVPTVFIVENCLWQKTAGLAAKIVKRVLQMSETNDIGPVKEVQIDCDYTLRSRERFYDLLQQMRTELRKHGIALSATIRLHQLRMPPPPVDEGVLMLYNTGDVTRRSDHNPILDMRDVAPYVRYLSDYQLPLTAAYPLFEWKVMFHHDTFRHIAYNSVDEQCKLKGDTLIHWQCTADDIVRVKEAVEKERKDLGSRVTLYHLDHQLLNHFKKEDYEKIFDE